MIGCTIQDAPGLYRFRKVSGKVVAVLTSAGEKVLLVRTEAGKLECCTADDGYLFSPDGKQGMGLKPIVITLVTGQRLMEDADRPTIIQEM